MFKNKNIFLFIFIVVDFFLVGILLYSFLYKDLLYSLLFFLLWFSVTYFEVQYYMKNFVAKRKRVKFRQRIRKIVHYITIFLILSFYLSIICISIWLGLYVTWFHGVLFFVVWFFLIFDLMDKKVYMYSVVLSYPFCYFIWIFYFGK
jgi:hypothetical protein